MEMRNKKTDRRSMRSKKAILDAFADLVLEKDIKNISVANIIKRANIGRTTFYAHFEDTANLHSFILSRLLLQLEQEIEQHLVDSDVALGSSQSLIPSLALFKISAEKHAIFKANAETPEVGLGILKKPLIARLEKQLDEMGAPEPQDDISRHMIATYLISALLALLLDWVLEDMPEPPEMIDRTFQLLAEPTLKRLLGSGF